MLRSVSRSVVPRAVPPRQNHLRRHGMQAVRLAATLARQRQTQRFWTILGAGTVAAVAGASVLSTMQENMLFYMTPTQLIEHDPPLPSSRTVRLGGLVAEDSVQRHVDPDDPLSIQFVVTDLSADVTVRYTGLLPDLFREGSSVVVEGHVDVLEPAPVFTATEVLAKHDESYMPADIAEQVQRNKQDSADAATAAQASSAGDDDGDHHHDDSDRHASASAS